MIAGSPSSNFHRRLWISCSTENSWYRQALFSIYQFYLYDATGKPIVEAMQIDHNWVEKTTLTEECRFCEWAWKKKSVAGHVFYLNGTPIIWRSKKQTVVSKSSIVAEYYELAEAVERGGIYLKRLVGELCMKPNDMRISINSDNA